MHKFALKNLIARNNKRTNLSCNCLATFTNIRAWVTLKSVNSEMKPCRKFIMSRLICSSLDFEMFGNAS